MSFKKTGLFVLGGAVLAGAAGKAFYDKNKVNVEEEVEKSKKKDVLFAVGARYLEEEIADNYKDEFNFKTDVVTNSSELIKKVDYHQPDVLIIRDGLKGTTPIEQLIGDIRKLYPEIQIIFITNRTNTGDELLKKLVRLGVYDLVTRNIVSISQVGDSLRNPRGFDDVVQFTGIYKDITLTQEFTFNVEELIEDHGTVDDIYESLFILPDGTMIDGDFNDGVRVSDHDLMFEYVGIDIYRENYKGDYWELVHELTGAVRLFPETRYGLIKVGQILTDEQRELLEVSDFIVKEY